MLGPRSDHVRSGLGTCSERGPIGTATRRLCKARCRFRGRRCNFARSSTDFVAGAALSQGQVFLRLELRGRRCTFARRGANFVAGATLSQGQVQISWQAQHFRSGRHSPTFSLGQIRLAMSCACKAQQNPGEILRDLSNLCSFLS